MSERWPVILTPSLMREYLGCDSDSTFRRRLEVLKGFGLPDKDEELKGWYRPQVDEALEKKSGGSKLGARRKMIEAAGGGEV